MAIWDDVAGGLLDAGEAVVENVPPWISPVGAVAGVVTRGNDKANERNNARKSLGRFTSTSYGPPWDAMNGTGVTAGGTNLKDAPRKFIVAVDPAVIPLGTKLRITPNPFNHRGDFIADDTGGAIKGKRIDFYDWRGRTHQRRWGRRPVTVTQVGEGGGNVGVDDTFLDAASDALTPDPLEDVGEFLSRLGSTLFSGAWWRRVLFILAGAGLIYISALLFMREFGTSTIGRALK
jgi:3D (Asp-Asp-Asp) domain-containing protein